jgi:hypothetical protein
VLLVAGNHEAYDRHLDATIAALRRAGDELPPASRPLEGTGTYFLHRDAVRIGDVRFLGCTFWTRFRLFDGRRAEAMRACRGQMDDYQRIHLLRARRLLRPRDTDRIHRGAAHFLRREAGRQDTPARATVVITHHAPSPGSVDPRYEEDLTSAAFVARRDNLIREVRPDAWIHGHVHASFDYQVGPTRLVANPRGHPGENPAFRPDFVIEV